MTRFTWTDVLDPSVARRALDQSFTDFTVTARTGRSRDCYQYRFDWTVLR